MNIREVVNCKRGWSKLYTPIIEEIIEHDMGQQNVDEKIGVYEIKEKFGCLDIQVINAKNLTAHLLQLIHDAHIKSECTCEYCGSEEHIGHTTNFWRKSVCESCWKNCILPYIQPSTWVDDSEEIKSQCEN